MDESCSFLHTLPTYHPLSKTNGIFPVCENASDMDNVLLATYVRGQLWTVIDSSDII